MKSNPPSTSSVPPPTFTYATTCTVPRSFSSLASSCTPFYPRSQQQHYFSQPGSAGGHDGGCYGSPQKLDDNAADNNCLYMGPRIDSPNFYNQSNYASLGSEPYEVSWIPEGFYGGNTCGVLGAWQWGDPASVEYAYAGEAGHSAYLPSDSLSYPAGSPPIEEESYTSSPSNTASLPAPFHGRGVTVTSSVIQSRALPEQGRCWLNNKNSITAIGGSPVASFKKMDDSEKQGPAEGIRNEAANGSAIGKLDGRSTLDKQSSQICSSVDVEPAMEQVTRNTVKKHQFQTENKKLSQNSSNHNLEQGSAEDIETKASIRVSTNPSHGCESLEGNKLDSPTICMESFPAEIVQEDVGNINSLSVQSSHTSVLSTSDCTHSQHANAQASWSTPGKTSPPEQENCCGSPIDTVKAHLVMGMEGRPCDDAIFNVESLHYDKIGSSNCLPLEVGLCLNGSQLLIKSIYNLCKVLLTSQSGDSSNGFHHMDSAIENSICMLSHCLLQRSSVNEAVICHDQHSYQGQSQVAQQDLKRSDVATVLDDEAGIQNLLKKCLRPLVSTQNESTFSPAETGPCRKALESEGSEYFSKVSMKSCVEEDESSSVKKHLGKPLKELSELQGKLMKLQEEIAYERVESNATVSTYKNLWSEAQEALDASRSEIMKIRAELQGLKQASRKLKHTEGSTGRKVKAVELEFTGHDMDSSCINHESLYENFPDIVTNSSQNFMAQFTCRKPESDSNSGFCGSSGEGLPKSNEVLTGYFDLMKIVQVDSNCTEKSWAPSLLENEKVISRHSLQATTNQNGGKFGIAASRPSEKHRVEPPTDLENGVAQRLSLLLAREGMDLNVTCTDSVSAVGPPDFNNFFGLSANALREGETMPPGIKPSSIFQQQVPFQATTNQNGDKFGSEPFAKHRVEPPTDLENGVAQRLPLLLARQGLDLNVTCTDSVSADGSPSDSNKFSANVLREGETMPTGIKPSSIFQQQVPFQSETLYAAGANKQVGCERAGSSCLTKSDLESKDVRADISRMSHGHVDKGHHARAAEIDKAKTIWSTYQEDEIEIICLRPSDADNNLTCLKGEPEWEHVVVARGMCT